jgi:hypothetical protein
VPQKIIHPFLSCTYVYSATKKTLKGPEGEGAKSPLSCFNLAKGALIGALIFHLKSKVFLTESTLGVSCVSEQIAPIGDRNINHPRTFGGLRDRPQQGLVVSPRLRFPERHATRGARIPSSREVVFLECPRGSLKWFSSSVGIKIADYVASVPHPSRPNVLVAGGRGQFLPGSQSFFSPDICGDRIKHT